MYIYHRTDTVQRGAASSVSSDHKNLQAHSPPLLWSPLLTLLLVSARVDWRQSLFIQSWHIKVIRQGKLMLYLLLQMYLISISSRDYFRLEKSIQEEYWISPNQRDTMTNFVADKNQFISIQCKSGQVQCGHFVFGSWSAPIIICSMNFPIKCTPIS